MDRWMDRMDRMDEWDGWMGWMGWRRRRRETQGDPGRPQVVHRIGCGGIDQREEEEEEEEGGREEQDEEEEDEAEVEVGRLGENLTTSNRRWGTMCAVHAPVSLLYCIRGEPLASCN
jgi:hypothetical protein